MLDQARRQAAEEGLNNVTFAQADAQIHRFDPRAYDVAISRTAAMFFGDHVAAAVNHHSRRKSSLRAVRPLGDSAPAERQVLARVLT